jgi:hypothetical protein
VTAATAAAVATGATGYTFIATGGSTAEKQQQQASELGKVQMGSTAVGRVGNHAKHS